jgi:hypothetical protein
MSTRFLFARICIILLGTASQGGPTFDQAASETDPAKRAEAVLPFLDPADPVRYRDTLNILEGCGKASLPTLQSVLADETRFRESPQLLQTLAKAGGKAAIPVLENLLRDDKVYWNNLGMNLDEPQKIPAARAERLVSILRHLAGMGYRDRHHLVRDVRDRFSEHPILCNYGRSAAGDGGMSSCPVIDAAQTILSR